MWTILKTFATVLVLFVLVSIGFLVGHSSHSPPAPPNDSFAVDSNARGAAATYVINHFAIDIDDLTNAVQLHVVINGEKYSYFLDSRRVAVKNGARPWAHPVISPSKETRRAQLVLDHLRGPRNSNLGSSSSPKLDTMLERIAALLEPHEITAFKMGYDAGAAEGDQESERRYGDAVLAGLRSPASWQAAAGIVEACRRVARLKKFELEELTERRPDGDTSRSPVITYAGRCDELMASRRGVADAS